MVAPRVRNTTFHKTQWHFIKSFAAACHIAKQRLIIKPVCTSLNDYDCYVVLYVAHTWTVWPRRWMTNCRRPVWSALQNCVKTMTSQEMSCLRWVTPAYVDHIRALTRNYTVYNILVDNICIQTSPRLFADFMFSVFLRSCQSVLANLSKERWTSTTGGSSLLQLLLLATKPGYEGSSAPSQGKHCSDETSERWQVCAVKFGESELEH